MHAHTTPEAFTIEEHLLAVNIGGLDKRIEVFLPHPFSYVLLKLFALRDLMYESKKEFGRHHAFDIYSTWAMMTEEEFEQAEQLRVMYNNVGVMVEAVEIARGLFGNETAMGMIRLREHARIQNIDLLESSDFIKDISTLFGTSRVSAG